MDTFSTAEHYLRDFHQRHVGVTSAAFANLPARSGGVEHASSYAALAAAVPDTNAALTVLDLACGDGHLLKMLARRQQAGLRLIGIDMSQEELALAKTSLPHDVTLINGRAQSLTLASGSIDCVISHMALMLMDGIEQVVSEIHRVLRPNGGRLAAVVGRTFLLGEVNEILMHVLRPIASEALLPMSFGDRRTGSESGWSELLGANFNDIKFENMDVIWQPGVNELWTALMLTYDIDRLSDEPRECLRVAFLDAVKPLQRDDGTIVTGWGLRLIQARTR